MMTKRTDLALEARELFEESVGKTTALQGVQAQEYGRRGCTVTEVDILDGQGSRALGKPVGRYLTVALEQNNLSGKGFEEAARCIAEELHRLLPPLDEEKPVLVAGLGNRDVTPDALGPLAVDALLITRHLKESLPGEFAALSPVCAIAPGVLGQTGVESAEVIRGVAERVKPCCVIVIDALMSRRLSRLCATVQLSDTGLIPGSGVGNHRCALNEDTLHVPVLSIGIPTVIDGATLAADLLEEAGAEETAASLREGMIVTERSIDERIRRLARLTALGVNLALQSALDVEDVAAFLS